MFSFKLSSGKTYTREGLMADAQWLLLLVGALQIQAALVIAILSRAFVFDAVVFASAGGIFALMAFIPVYWGRFFAMLVWTAAMVFDFYLRQNPFTVFFILVGVLTVYKMLRFHKGSAS